ncbi:Amidophosphoribosyltransferase [Streptomyces alboniger]
MPPAKKRARTYDPGRIRTAVLTQFGTVRQAVRALTPEQLAPGSYRGRSRPLPTTGASVWENAQPTFRATAHGSIALGHNGNLVNTAQLAEMVADLPKDTNGRSTRVAATNDTDLAYRSSRPRSTTTASR